MDMKRASVGSHGTDRPTVQARCIIFRRYSETGTVHMAMLFHQFFIGLVVLNPEWVGSFRLFQKSFNLVYRIIKSCQI